MLLWRSSAKKAECLEDGTLEAVEIRGNSPSDTISDNVIDLDSSSPSTNIDDIPLNKVYETLDKAFTPSSSSKTTKKHVDDVYVPLYPYVLERIGDLSQRRIDVCQKLPVTHWLQPPFIQPLQTIPADEQFEDESVEPTFNNLKSTSSQPQPSNQTSDSFVLDDLSNHYNGELPDFESNSEKASETEPYSTVS